MSTSPTVQGAKGGANSDNETSTDQDLECSICLTTAVHPVRLPCSHIFCFLCVKGSANRSKKCALCRQVIPATFLFKPTLLKKEELSKDASLADGFHWYYEGNRGWWRYDERTSAELEAHYKEKSNKLEVLIAGFLYVVDFESMVQYRRNDPSRRRKIKRDVSNIPIKGVAGLKIDRPETVAVDRREGDGGIEIDSNQNQPSTNQNQLARTSSSQSQAVPSATDTVDVNREQSETLPHQEGRGHGNSSNMSVNETAQASSLSPAGDGRGTDINRNTNEDAPLDTALSNTLSLPQIQGDNCVSSPAGAKNARSPVSHGASNLCETTTRNNPHSQRTLGQNSVSNEDDRDDSVTVGMSHMTLNGQNAESSRTPEPQRMRLRSRLFRSAKRHSSNS